MESIRPRTGRVVEAAAGVRIRLARGEYESVQILVAPKDRDLKGVKVDVAGDLTLVESQRSKVESLKSTSLSTFQPFNLSTPKRKLGLAFVILEL